jgi:4-aminobutyrate aminotransferase
MRREDWQQRNVTGATRTWLERDAATYMAQKGSTPCLTSIKSGKGAWLEDHEGKQYLDLYGNSVHHVGYRHPRMIEALTAQLNELTFSPRRFTNEPAVLLAECLLKHWPAGSGKVLLTTGGSDAIELAMKIARTATSRYKTISFYDSYHGSGFGALSVGGRYADRSSRLGPLLEGAIHVPPFYLMNDDDAQPTDSLQSARASLEAVRYVFERERDIGAVIAEPIRSTPHTPPDWYWPEVRKLCDDYGALLIFDEIPTGLGKTGKMFSSDHVGACPDLTVLGKALGGGVVPMGAVLLRDELDCSPELSLGHYTHEKNPFCARAALTTLQIIEDDRLVEHAAQLGVLAKARVEEMQKRQPLIRRMRGHGLLFAIELQAASARVPRADIVDSIFWRTLEKGINLSASEGRDLSITAPLIITKDELLLGLDMIEEAIAEEWAELSPWEQ